MIDKQSYWSPIEKCEISINKKSASPSIKCNEFPLTLSWASAGEKVQVLSLEKGFS